MDLSNFDTKTTATLHLLHPVTSEPLYADSDPVTGERPKDAEGKGLPMTITGYGADSKEYRTIQSDILRKRQLKTQRANKGKRKKEEEIFDLEDMRANATDILSGVITAWSEIENGGVPVECNETGKAWLMESVEWIRDQWDEFLNDRASFLQSA